MHQIQNGCLPHEDYVSGDWRHTYPMPGPRWPSPEMLGYVKRTKKRGPGVRVGHGIDRKNIQTGLYTATRDPEMLYMWT